MRYMDVERRLRRLEAAGPQPVVIVELFDEHENPLPPEEEARRIAAAKEQAGPRGIVVLWRYEEGVCGEVRHD